MKWLFCILIVYIVIACSEFTEPNMCGNGVIDQNEQCDGVDIDGMNCYLLGMFGTLECNDQCQFTGCIPIPEELL